MFWDGQAIRVYRLSRGIGLRELADEIGWSATYLSDIERNQRLCDRVTFTRIRVALERVVGPFRRRVSLAKGEKP